MSIIFNFFKLIAASKYKYIYAGMRRRFIFYFAPGYLKKQLAKRRGGCALSGHCCKMTLPWCAYLKNGLCLLGSEQPIFCKIFPIDEKDKDLSDVKNMCNYYFASPASL